ncbi:MAG: DUF2911 domain-containing protein [Cyclobacteriaceae bacterium]|nr:DUF2911 domain-containing protein [Cyclobacteriaceae bacterium]
MKKFSFLVILFFLYASLSYGQYFRGLDKSPMDVAYFPDNYAHDRKAGEKAIIKVTYSRPQRRGRDLFGDLIPYGEVWRTGANEATEIRIYQPLTIQGQPVEPGIYSLYTIPEPDKWTTILNEDLDYWGSYSYLQDHDVLRIEAPVRKMDQNVEVFTIQFEATGEGTGKMQIAWGETLVEVPIQY